MKHYTSTIPYDLAEKLKAAGYDEPCSHYYHIYPDNKEESGLSLESTGDMQPNFFNSLNTHRVAAPTYAEVFDWFESKYIGIGVKHHCSGLGYDWQVCQFDRAINPYFVTFYTSWHEAANAAITKALELI